MCLCSSPLDDRTVLNEADRAYGVATSKAPKRKSKKIKEKEKVNLY